MVSFRGVAFASLLITFAAACDGGPLEPTITDVTITVMDEGTGDKLSGAEVTCLRGCSEQSTQTTDLEGRVVLSGILPLRVGLEREWYHSSEAEVTENDGVVTMASAVVDIAVTVTDEETNDSLSEVGVTCLHGCPERQTDTTDSEGRVVLSGILPLRVGLEREWYHSSEAEVTENDGVVTMASAVVDIAVTVTDEETNDSLSEVGVTCLQGCPERQTDTTDSEGRVVLSGILPLRVGLEREWYHSSEAEVTENDGVVTMASAVVDIAVNFTLPYYNDTIYVFPPLTEVSVTCTQSCPVRMTLVTNDEGKVTFGGIDSIFVRAEKEGHIPNEQWVSDGDRLFLGHVWPEESDQSFEMLRIPEGLLLNWRKVMSQDEAVGNFGCTALTGANPVITIFWYGEGEMTVRVIEHELFHAHQYAFDSGPVRAEKCNLVPWAESEEGQAYKKAEEADRKISNISMVDSVPGRPEHQKYTEGSANFWVWWRWARDDPQDEELARILCSLAPNRCALYEEWFGPRRKGYP